MNQFFLPFLAEKGGPSEIGPFVCIFSDAKNGFFSGATPREYIE